MARSVFGLDFKRDLWTATRSPTLRSIGCGIIWMEGDFDEYVATDGGGACIGCQRSDFA